MSDLLLEPGSKKHGPRIGVTYMVKYYDYVDRNNKTPPWFTDGYSAGVFLAKPGISLKIQSQIIHVLLKIRKTFYLC